MDSTTSSRPPLLGILVVAAGVRLWGLDAESLWLDEAATVHYARQPLAALVAWTVSDVHPPLYNLILAGWIRLVGSGEIAVRLPSVVFGVLSVALTFWLTRRWFDDRTAGYAALFLSLLPLCVEYAQEARSYSLLLLLAVASMAAFTGMSTTGRSASATAWIVATTLLVYTHLFGWLVVLVQAIETVRRAIRTSAPRRAETLAWVALVVLFLPWLPVVLDQASQKSLFWLRPPQPRDVFYLLGGGLVGARHEAAAIATAAGLLSVSAWARREPDRDARERLVLCTLWAVVPVAAAWIVSVGIEPVFAAKYLILVAPAWAILMGVGVSRLTFAPGRWAAAAVVVAFSGSLVWSQHETVRKEQWRAAAELLEREAEPSEPIALHRRYVRYPFAYYAMPACFGYPDIHGCLWSRNVYPTDELEMLPESARRAERIWLVLSHAEGSPDAARILSDLGRFGRHELHRRYVGIDVHVFRRTAPRHDDDLALPHGGR